MECWQVQIWDQPTRQKSPEQNRNTWLNPLQPHPFHHAGQENYQCAVVKMKCCSYSMDLDFAASAHTASHKDMQKLRQQDNKVKKSEGRREWCWACFYSFDDLERSTRCTVDASWLTDCASACESKRSSDGVAVSLLSVYLDWLSNFSFSRH